MKEQYVHKGIIRWRDVPDPVEPVRVGPMREYLGQTLRESRKSRGIPLREIPGVALGYMSEIERGAKEVSSEVLETFCNGLGISVADVLRQTADRIDAASSAQRAQELVNA